MRNVFHVLCSLPQRLKSSVAPSVDLPKNNPKRKMVQDYLNSSETLWNMLFWDKNPVDAFIIKVTLTLHLPLTSSDNISCCVRIDQGEKDWPSLKGSESVMATEIDSIQNYFCLNIFHLQFRLQTDQAWPRSKTHLNRYRPSTTNIEMVLGYNELQLYTGSLDGYALISALFTFVTSFIFTRLSLFCLLIWKTFSWRRSLVWLSQYCGSLMLLKADGDKRTLKLKPGLLCISSWLANLVQIAPNSVNLRFIRIDSSQQCHTNRMITPDY